MKTAYVKLMYFLLFGWCYIRIFFIQFLFIQFFFYTIFFIHFLFYFLADFVGLIEAIKIDLVSF